jgi:hypothetical protein
MINAKRFGHMLVFCLTTTLGYSQDLDSEYVAPVHRVPRGEAPGMKVQLLKGGMENKEYAIIFGKGDEAFSGLQEFVERYRIQSAHFTAIGTLNGLVCNNVFPRRSTNEGLGLRWVAEMKSSKVSRSRVC